MKNILNYEKFLEDVAALGNTGGMGNVVAPTVSAIPGDVSGSIPGSGDVANGNFGMYMKNPQYQSFNQKSKKKKKKLKKFSQL
jgi:hypothetical protein